MPTPRDATQVASCPVSCIHKVGRQDLPLLEYVARNVVQEPRPGRELPSLFSAAATFQKQYDDLKAKAAQPTSADESTARKHAAEGSLRSLCAFTLPVQYPRRA